jgi:hypothetical protein
MRSCSPNIVRLVISRRMGWTELIARMGKREMHIGFWWGDAKVKKSICKT